MKTYRFVKYILVASVALLLFACSTDDSIWVEDGKEVAVSFRPTIDNSMASRAIGDASSIDELVVGVYNEDKSNLIYTKEVGWDEVQNEGVALTLIEGRTYLILFWAQDGGNTAYTFTNKGIEVNYGDYTDGGFSRMEEMDAFYGIAELTVGSQNIEDKGLVKLIRPFAQLNFADKTIQPTRDTHKAVVTFHSIPKSFNPFTGDIEMTDVNDTADDIRFVFTDFPTNENLTISQVPYYYVASNYLFVPASGTASIEVTLDLQLTDDTNINKFEFKGEKAIKLEKNKKTNVLGNIVQQPETWSVWDGTSETEPTLEQDRYVIDNAADIAWLSKKGNTLDPNKTFVLTTDIDMAQKSGLSSIQLPQESTLDGGEHTIKGLSLDGGLLGNIVNVSVQDLTIEGAAISNSNTAVTHIGVLANTLAGSATFSNVTIKKSSVSTFNGAAGGMIGYVSRISKNSRTDSLNVSFDNCHVIETSVEGSISEGHFVGLLRGYDNAEKLTFNNNCSLTSPQTATVANEFVSPYTEGNEGSWLATNDYSKFNGWLGNEECYRGTVMYGSNRFIPRWDGTTFTAKADLLLHNGESNEYEVYSPFDLAGVRHITESPAALYLMENVDMFGQGADGEYNVPSNWTQSANDSEDDMYFMSFSTIPYLDGNDYGIYNLNINTQKVYTSLYYGGFIQSTTGTTTHKNIKFYNSCVVVPLVVYKNEDKGSAGMLVSNIAGDSYTMNNVHTHGCKIFALQKVGGIAARVAATTSTISNCSVNGGYIENYECKEHIEEFGGGIAKFYSYGEIGGMFGFVQDNTTISNCKVENTTIYAFGQGDQLLGAVPGRHVSMLIGDIRTYVGGTINISNTSVDSNTKCLKTHNQHSYGGFFGVGAKKVREIGKCYYVATDDTKGKVIFNGTTIF